MAAGALIALTFPAMLSADDNSFSFPIDELRFNKITPAATLSLANKATVKTVAARRLVVSGPNPEFTVTGVASCDEGAKLTGVQVFAGGMVNHGGQIVPMQAWGQSAKNTAVAGQKAALVTMKVKVNMTREVGDSLVDLTFNPAREFDRKLTVFAANGGSAASYMHTAEAFDMAIPIHFAAWCKMGPNHKTFPNMERGGFVRRDVPVTILYQGDPKIVDGVGVRATVGGTEGGKIAPPAKPKPQRVKTPE
ncbi:MAG: hypothetical protein CVT87_01370 [Alphaproteobacteria bacterium HGW-Alphaproteobacteria-9]|nr:hypothetical protein [Erythrobacter sp.]PKP66631.1 MAG: hypothetical protein CVT87_01370 [Alphaproteobacteria bacterium HGW-Alphaproteobacteria-9]